MTDDISLPSPAVDREVLAALFRAGPGQERLGDRTPGEIADALISAGVCGPVEQPVVTRAQIDAAAMEMLHQVRDGGAGSETRRAFIRSVAREWGLSVEGGE